MGHRSSGGRAPLMRRLTATVPALAAMAFVWLAGAGSVGAQEIRGRVVDSGNGAGVALAQLILLDAEREPLLVQIADTAGYYGVAVPGAGEYYLVVERLGYFENETPLFAVGDEGEYGIDLEMRPEPIRLDPLAVTVDNERLEEFLRLELGVHPATLRGYRAIQGRRLEEAKLAAADNTDFLRHLYIPVSHGAKVCIGWGGIVPSLPGRMTVDRVNEAADKEREQLEGFEQCGGLYLDGHRCRNEQLESIDLERIGVVVTLETGVYLYTRNFEWTFEPGGGRYGC